MKAARVVPQVARAALSQALHRPLVRGAVVLAYHDVVPDDAEPFPYAVPRRIFRRQLDVLRAGGVRVAGLGELASRLSAGEPIDGLAAIAFDDALLGVHELALPELRDRGWTATLHPVVDRLGVHPQWWPGSRRTMTAREVGQAVGEGFEVAAHGSTHACLPCLSDRALRDELHRSREVLGELAGDRPAALAYPFGHHDARVRDAAVAAGYASGWTFLNGRFASATDPWRLPRLTMHAGLGAARLAVQLARRPSDWPASDQDVVHPPHR